MPDAPSWDEVATIAREINSPDMAGICLRGKPGWGDLGAAFTTVLNTFGGTWWAANPDGSIGAAQIDQPEFKEALTFYVNLLNDAGETDAANASYNECLSQYQDNKVAMWYDATVAASNLEATGQPGQGSQRLCTCSYQGDGRFWLAVGMGPRHPEECTGPGHRMAVRGMGDRS